ncbi:MAG TPA: hypothetical protein PKA81_00230 [Clostridia bacterium]|nr:hypothetical protein [Clostridia bacterium]
MKKRLLAILMLVLCLCYTGSTFALAPDEETTDIEISPLSVLSVDCGLSNSGGSTYLAWANATSSVSETITVTVKLYRVVGSTLTLITSGSNTASGTSAYVSKSASLTAGSYRVVATASGSISSSASRTRNYTVN